MLARELEIGMADTVMPGQRISTAECLLFCAHVAADLLLPRVVNRVFVTRQIVGPREHRVARLASARVDAFALVRSCLCVEEVVWSGRALRSAQSVQPVRLSMSLALMLLQSRWRLEPLRATVIRAGVCTAIGTNTVRSPRAPYCRSLW